MKITKARLFEELLWWAMYVPCCVGIAFVVRAIFS